MWLRPNSANNPHIRILSFRLISQFVCMAWYLQKETSPSWYGWELSTKFNFYPLRLLKYIIIEKDELPLGKKKNHSLLYPRVINFLRLNTGHVLFFHWLGRNLLVYSFEWFIYIVLVLANLSFCAVVYYLFVSRHPISKHVCLCWKVCR